MLVASTGLSNRPHSLAAIIAGATLALAAFASALGWHEFPAPFFWLDVAVVYFLAALPVAASLVAAVWRQLDGNRRRQLGSIVLELTVLLLLPWLYVHARTQNDIARCIDLVRQSRYGEASDLVWRTLQLAPRAKWNSNPFADTAATIDQVVHRLENSLSSPLGG